MCNNSEIKRDDRVQSILPHAKGGGEGTVRYVYPGEDGDLAVVEWDGGKWRTSRAGYLRKVPTVIRAYNVYWDAEHMKVVAFWSETREIADEISHHSDARLNLKRIGVLDVYDNGEVELEPCQQQNN